MIEVTCAIILDNNKVLVTRRSATMAHPLKWEFPGGKVKEGESPESSIRREIREELGLSVEVDRQLPSVIHHYETHSIQLIPFICTVLEGAISLSEHQEYRWTPCGELDGVDWLEADLEVVGLIRQRGCQ